MTHIEAVTNKAEPSECLRQNGGHLAALVRDLGVNYDPLRSYLRRTRLTVQSLMIQTEP